MMSMRALQGPIAPVAAPFWAHGVCTSVGVREAAGTGQGAGAGGSYPSVAPQGSGNQTTPTSTKAPSSNTTSQNNANPGASAAKPPSTSNIPPRLDVSGISVPSESNARPSQQQQDNEEPPIRPLGGAGEGGGQGPSPPGSRGRVMPTPAAAAAAASESVPAPRAAQVLGYAGVSVPLSRTERSCMCWIVAVCYCHAQPLLLQFADIMSRCLQLRILTA